MKRSRRLWIALCVAAVVWPIAAQWKRQVRAPLAHADEAAWIFLCVYFQRAFLERDFRHPDWHDPLVYHHPPLARYIFGAALTAQGLSPHTLEDFRWWQENDMDYAKMYWRRFWREMEARVPPQALATVRTISAVFALLACGMLFFVGRRIQPVVGIAAALWLAWLPLLRLTAGIGAAETMLLFFLLASVWAGLKLWDAMGAEVSARTRAVATVGWGLACALAFSVKLNGLLGWLFGAAGLLWGTVVSADQATRLRCLGALAGGTAVFLLATIALNPTLWNDPWGNLAQYFLFRWQQMARQREFGFFNEFADWHRRASYFLKLLFFEHDLSWNTLRLPLGLVFFSAGISKLLGQLSSLRLSRELPPAAWLCLGGSLFAAATFYSFFMNWARYLLPLLPWVTLVQAVGVVSTFDPLWSSPGTATQRVKQWWDELAARGRFWLVLGIIALTLAWYCYGPLFPQVSRYSGAENLPAQNLRVLQNTLKRHPNNRTYRVQLAIALQQMGKEQEAAEQWALLAQPITEEEFPPCDADLDRFFREAESLFPHDPRVQAEVARHRDRCRN